MTATLDAGPGLQSEMSVNANPVVAQASMASSPHVWSWIWFAVAVLVILGFHIRIFGRAVPPAASFP